MNAEAAEADRAGDPGERFAAPSPGHQLIDRTAALARGLEQRVRLRVGRDGSAARERGDHPAPVARPGTTAREGMDHRLGEDLGREDIPDVILSLQDDYPCVWKGMGDRPGVGLRSRGCPRRRPRGRER